MPWWTRIWTAQECVLPIQATICYGPFTFDWRTMLQVSAIIERPVASCCEPFISHLGAQSQVAMRNIRHLCLKLFELGTTRDNRLLSSQSFQGRDLLGILHQFFPRDATDARDKVYGLLGLLESRYFDLIDPDYTNSIEHVYEDATFTIICANGFPQILDNLCHQRMSIWKHHFREPRYLAPLASWAVD